MPFRIAEIIKIHSESTIAKQLQLRLRGAVTPVNLRGRLVLEVMEVSAEGLDVVQFHLRNSSQRIEARGIRRRVEAGPRATLEQRCRLALKEGYGSPLVGSFPFGDDLPDFLYEPAFVQRAPYHAHTQSKAVAPASIELSAFVAHPTEADFARMVEQALDLLAQQPGSALEKVVLSRQLQLFGASGLDYDALLDSLSQDLAATAFRVDLSEQGDHLLIGATPEKLISRKGLHVSSLPLAGSIPRGKTEVEDRERAEQLSRSEKDSREHAMTREFVLDTLNPFCRELGTQEGTILYPTATMWHLGTAIEGKLKGADMPSAAGLAAALHPTPAVGGFPREAARAAIADIEPYDRGFYAGAIGYVDGSGDGEWYVSLRCAELTDDRLTLHAGAGIVAGSEPDQEVRETAAKFRAMLRAMGVADVTWAGQEAAE
ncbi:isochorismate synthase [Aurantiacibacter flavus]|uniref:isochorismate synthase n=1 Tax=Aurantiacibacter flavus TaxID=3145232 RepID=A0ABV0D179_9SPHN